MNPKTKNSYGNTEPSRVESRKVQRLAGASILALMTALSLLNPVICQGYDIVHADMKIPECTWKFATQEIAKAGLPFVGIQRQKVAQLLEHPETDNQQLGATNPSSTTMFLREIAGATATDQNGRRYSLNSSVMKRVGKKLPGRQLTLAGSQVTVRRFAIDQVVLAIINATSQITVAAPGTTGIAAASPGNFDITVGSGQEWINKTMSTIKSLNSVKFHQYDMDNTELGHSVGNLLDANSVETISLGVIPVGTATTIMSDEIVRTAVMAKLQRQAETTCPPTMIGHKVTVRWRIHEIKRYFSKGSANIFAQTLRAVANVIAGGLDITSLVEQLPEYKPAAGIGTKPPSGPYVHGTLGNKLIIANPFYNAQEYVELFRGDNYLFAGIVFAPYVPLTKYSGVSEKSEMENSVTCGKDSCISGYSVEDYQWAEKAIDGILNPVTTSEWSQSAAKLLV